MKCSKRSRRRSVERCISELYKARDDIADVITRFQIETGLTIDEVDILAPTDDDFTSIGMLRLSAADRSDENSNVFITTYTKTTQET